MIYAMDDFEKFILAHGQAGGETAAIFAGRRRLVQDRFGRGHTPGAFSTGGRLGPETTIDSQAVRGFDVCGMPRCRSAGGGARRQRPAADALGSPCQRSRAPQPSGAIVRAAV